MMYPDNFGIQKKDNRCSIIMGDGKAQFKKKNYQPPTYFFTGSEKTIYKANIYNISNV